MSIADYDDTLKEPDDEEPCTGDLYECRCASHLALWADIMADRAFDSRRDS